LRIANCYSDAIYLINWNELCLNCNNLSCPMINWLLFFTQPCMIVKKLFFSIQIFQFDKSVILKISSKIFMSNTDDSISLSLYYLLTLIWLTFCLVLLSFSYQWWKKLYLAILIVLFYISLLLQIFSKTFLSTLHDSIYRSFNCLCTLMVLEYCLLCFSFCYQW